MRTVKRGENARTSPTTVASTTGTSTTGASTTAAESERYVGSVYIRRLRMAASAFAALVAVAGLITTPLHTAAAATAAGSPAAVPADNTPGPVTLSGHGAFANLNVTVSQTQNLINQNVNISWTGGVPTVPSTVSYNLNFLQIMECWGDSPSGPDPSQCEYGVGSNNSNPGGASTATRQLTYQNLTDPLEKDIPPNYPSSSPVLYMPFVPAPSNTPTAPYSRPPLTSDGTQALNYFDVNDSNEVDYARTDSNGTGNQYFEMDTVREASGLGCGQSVTDDAGKTTVEPCWLVVVPRGDTEVDGSLQSGTDADHSMRTSPLSATNWANRIVFPLTFEPAASACAIGADEVEVDGDEQAALAMSHWQPGLCAQNPTTPYSYSDIGGDESRSLLSSGSPSLDFISQPLVTPAGETAPDVLYAPVAVSALTISFYIQSQGGVGEAADQNGVQITHLNLNARLLAKLLTQSYQNGVGVFPGAPTDVPAQNPFDLTSDPEFKELNPQFDDLDFAADSIPTIIVPFGNADAYTEVWTWINNDPAARGFLNGTPDNQGPYAVPGSKGMVVNPNYFKLQLAIEDFPTNDPWCQPGLSPAQDAQRGQQTNLCGIALHPYSTTLNAAAQAASQGSQFLRTTWTALPGGAGYDWGTTPPEPAGSIAVLALSDGASAAQYGLPTAQLCTDAATMPGGSVAQDCQGPTTAGMDAAIADATPSTVASGVLIPNPNAQYPVANPYPLTAITYAATVPADLSAAQGVQYGNMLDYIAGPGQVPGLAPGELAPGYAPLPKAMVQQTLDAAAFLTGGPAPTAGATPLGPVPGALPPFQLPTPLVPTPHGTGGPTAGTVVHETLPAADLAGQSATLANPVGAIRFVLLICLLAAALGFGVGPVLLADARRAAGTAPQRIPRQRRPRKVPREPEPAETLVLVAESGTGGSGTGGSGTGGSGTGESGSQGEAGHGESPDEASQNEPGQEGGPAHEAAPRRWRLRR